MRRLRGGFLLCLSVRSSSFGELDSLPSLSPPSARSCRESSISTDVGIRQGTCGRSQGEGIRCPSISRRLLSHIAGVRIRWEFVPGGMGGHET